MREHLPALSVFLPLVGSWGVLGFSLLSHRLSRLWGYGVLFLELYLDVLTLMKVLTGGPWHYSLGGWAPPWGIELVVTAYSALLACFLLLLALAAFHYLGSFGLMAGLLKSREAWGSSLLLVMVSALQTLLCARDGFTLYLFLQITVVAATGLWVCLVKQGWREGFYFLLSGSTGASLFLAGFLFLYSATGTLQLDDILAQLFIAKNMVMPLAAGLFLAGAWVTLFCFPAPFFFKDLLNQAPPFLLGFFSGALSRLGVYLLFLIVFFTLNVPGMVPPSWVSGLGYLMILLLLSCFVFAAQQKDFLHAVAFLSVAQLAYPLAGFVTGNKGALTGSLVELLSQVPAVMGLFTAVGMLSLKPSGTHPFSKLAGLGRQDFGMALTLIIFAFSIVGVPPTGGCFGKYYLLQGLWEKRDWFLMAPVGAALLFNLWPAFRFLWLLFEPRKAASSHTPVSLGAKAPLYLLAILTLLLGILHQEIIQHFVEPALPKAYQAIHLPNVPFLGHEVE